jgi:DNA-binding GntR family transcriptional regulator
LSVVEIKKRDQEGEVDRVYRILKSWILECVFKPGEFLSEVDLARKCETSRTPVREACNRLSQGRWIQSIRHKGYVIPQISVREIIETYEYRRLLECFSAERAAQVASPEQIQNLKKMIQAESKPNPSMKDILAVNDLFHIELAVIARNQRVLDELRLTLDYVHRLDILSTQRDTSWIPHAEIVAAVEARKPSQAHKAMAAHIDHSRDRMLKLFGG